MKIHHVALVVSDLARAERFYVDVLGLTVDRRWEARSIWLRLDDGTLLMLERVEGATAKAHCVALSIEPTDRAAWRAKLNAAGFPVTMETAYTLYVDDADGNRIALSHHPISAP